MLYITDTETASLTGGVVQVGMTILDDKFNVVSTHEDLVNPECKISTEAMGVHFIRDDMVENKPTLSQVINKYLPKQINGEVVYFVAHNATFDIRMLGIEDYIKNNDIRVLDTLELARILYTKQEVGNHKLGTLYHYFKCWDKMFISGNSHSALFDTAMTSLVLKAILDDKDITIDEAYLLLNTPVEDTLCLMKKYKESGLTWKQVLELDKSYCEWLYNNAKMQYVKRGDEVTEWFKSEFDKLNKS